MERLVCDCGYRAKNEKDYNEHLETCIKTRNIPFNKGVKQRLGGVRDEKKRRRYEMNEKLQALCDTITQQQQERLKQEKLDCQANLDNAICHYHIAKKYSRIDVGSSGRYMVVNSTGEIYGSKAYGVIHKGHFYGTLDTIKDYSWGEYLAYKKGTK